MKKTLNKSGIGELIIRVSLETYREMKKAQLIFRLGHFATTWQMDHWIEFCGKCKSWGHGVRNCKEKPRCLGGCDEAHEGACKGGRKPCINCGGRHFPWSFSCPERLSLIREKTEAVESAIELLDSAATV